MRLALVGGSTAMFSGVRKGGRGDFVVAMVVVVASGVRVEATGCYSALARCLDCGIVEGFIRVEGG